MGKMQFIHTIKYYSVKKETTTNKWYTYDGAQWPCTE